MDTSVKYQKFVVTQEGDGKMKPAKADSRATCYVAILVVLVVIAVAAICIAIGVGVGLSLTRNQPSPSQRGTGLSSDTTVTPEQLQGEYYGTEGGIRFSTTVNTTYVVLSVTTTSGDHVAYIVHLVAANMTMMSVNDTSFMVMEKEEEGRIKYDDYVVPKDAVNLMESIMSGNGRMTDDILQMLDNRTVDETRETVLYDLAMSDEAVWIIEAAQALGNRGILGSEYPSVMSFYQLALRLAISRTESDTDYKFKRDALTLQAGKQYQYNRYPRAIRCSSNGARCTNGRCPFRKYSNDCFGMCGKDCSCWSFVCGDCCVHQYCLTHDQCCADRGFFSFACLSVAWRVLGSQCSQTYKC